MERVARHWNGKFLWPGRLGVECLEVSMECLDVTLGGDEAQVGLNDLGGIFQS